jgi:peptidoglycan hydrolase-like protein with peptidoglycan-binding domain
VAEERQGRLRRGLAVARGRRALAAVVIAVATAATAVALADGSGGASGPEPSAKASGTGTVARRTLAERLTATGTIGYAGETTVLARLAGTVTALPAIGDVIGRGERLYAVSGEPVLLLYGSVPAYRTLADGVSDGKDVEQLEANLAALGYEPGTVDEEFTASTADAVAAWQEDLGLEASGEVELGRVAFLRGPQRVTELEATLGEALASAAADGTNSNAGGSELVAWRPEAEVLSEVEEPSEVTQETVEELKREQEKLKREKEHEREKREREKANSEAKGKPGQEPEQRGEEGASGSEEGSQGAAGGGGEQGGGESEGGSELESEPSSIPVMRTSSIRRVVSVELEANQQSIAHRGQEVEVVLPGGAEVPGKVTGLAAVEASGGEGGPGEEEKEAVVEATISVIGKRRIPALDGVSVSVLFTQQVRKQVLSVPLTALVAIGGERFAVYVRGDGGRKQIVVTPGLAADGYVEVEGKGLEAGMQVETGE